MTGSQGGTPSGGYDPWSPQGSAEQQGLGGYGYGPPPQYPQAPQSAPEPGQTPAPGHEPPPPREAASTGPRAFVMWLGWGISAILLAGLLVVLFFFWPNGGLLVRQTFSQSSLESGVARILTDVYRTGSVGAVDCPSNQEVRSGAVFACLVNVDGEPRRVQITVLNDRGDYEVGNPH